MPAQIRYVDHDLVKVRDKSTNKLVTTLFWGDSVRVTNQTQKKHEVQLFRRSSSGDVTTVDCVIPGKVKLRKEPFILKIRVVDVGQGDAGIVETPEGDLIVIDGGEESHLRRYLAASFAHVLQSGPLDLSAVVVTHGDADHYKGLTGLLEARGPSGEPMVTVQRVFHNGLVKGPSSEKLIFGKTAAVSGRDYIVDLENDLRRVSDDRMNKPFLKWKNALKQVRTANGKAPRVSRLQYGEDDAFSFLASEKLKVQVLGPIVEMVGGSPALPYLHAPGSRRRSDSHTINGHSVVLKLTYGNVRCLYGADLNAESEERLLAQARKDNISLVAELLKVPHHGSADFSPSTLEAIRPVVSVVSSGDESASKEYIHPRAGLAGALGKYSRASVERPLVYVTEMVAFFQRKKDSLREYVKKQFGIVHFRTDGERVLVVTHSGRDDQKESYAFTVNERGDVAFEDKTRVA